MNPNSTLLEAQVPSREADALYDRLIENEIGGGLVWPPEPRRPRKRPLLVRWIGAIEQRILVFWMQP